MAKQINIVLAGNPNSGKSSLFNQLTGLNQQIGNYPGVTVDKKTGHCKLSKDVEAIITDLPGIYGMYPKSEDEFVAHQVLLQPIADDNPDYIVVVADASNLKRNLLLCSQLMDLHIPVVLALTMVDIAENKGIKINTEALSNALRIPVIAINPRSNSGIATLKSTLLDAINKHQAPQAFKSDVLMHQAFNDIKKTLGLRSNYAALLASSTIKSLRFVNTKDKEAVENILASHEVKLHQIQAEDVLDRYQKIDTILATSIEKTQAEQKKSKTLAIDKVLLHPIWGYAIMLAVMFIIFQAIFWFASYPMDWIESFFGMAQAYVAGLLPENVWWANLITEGIIAGIGGIVIFVPQIAILFFFISILEDTGYMARISFLTDRLMRSVGLNGRSVMPLISGMACAIPAIMSARTIRNAKERLLTILVTPLMSCSARLPVYTLIISMFIPNEKVLGFFNMQGLVMMLMYVLGIIVALLVAYVSQFFLKSSKSDFFIMELPIYRSPRWENAMVTMFDKARVFVMDAGKVILVLSVILWFMASYGPPSKIETLEQKYEQLATAQQGILTDEQQEEFSNEKLANSYAGIIGHAIEPAIAPLGYDWKIGIALISSFAAREVFVSTMATLYSVGDVSEDDTPLREKMLEAKRPDGQPVYTLATGMSLMMFYAFAMQCIGTVAVVKRETKSWKWPIIQVVYMTALAYLLSFAAYHLFS